MKVVSSAAMAAIDQRTQTEFSIPGTLLMEDAGTKAWLLLRRDYGGDVPTGRVVVLAGKGNNGGDGFVMARQAAVDGVRQLTVVLAGGRPAENGDAGKMLSACQSLPMETLTWPEQADAVRARLGEAELVLDCVAGTGMRGPLKAPLSDLVSVVNAGSARVVAIDVPSGVGDEFRSGMPAIRAAKTLTMGLPKLCLFLPNARSLCGEIQVVPVGFPPALTADPAIPGEMLQLADWQRLARPIPADTYKNRRGHLSVFAGSVGTTGAAWLAASAAARCRLGLVTLFVDRDAYPVIAPRMASVMCRPWDGTPGGPPGWDPAGFSGVLVGPGWGLAETKAQWLRHLVSLPVGGVLDADGITLLSRIREKRGLDLHGRWILTPHPGEFSRLMSVPRDRVLDDPLGQALAAASQIGAVIVLKGHCTVVAAPDGRYWILDGPNPALATGGAGDVLAGIVAAGVAGGLSPVDAARFGVALHADVGRLAWRRKGWFLSEDLVPLLSRLLGRVDGVRGTSAEGAVES